MQIYQIDLEGQTPNDTSNYVGFAGKEAISFCRLYVLIPLVQKGLHSCKPTIASLGILQGVPVCCSAVSFFPAAFTPHFHNVHDPPLYLPKSYLKN